MNEDWKAYEKLVADIQKQLVPHASVQHNEFIIGKSGVKNQCDVTLRSVIGQYEFFCLIECKDWKEPVDVNTIRAFKQKLDDVGAMKGAVVAANGYTSEAAKLANSLSIDLYSATDTASHKWNQTPLIPVRVTKIRLESAVTEIYSSSGEKILNQESNNTAEILNHIALTDKITKENFNYKQLIEAEWDSIFEKHLPAPNEWFETPKDRLRINITGKPSFDGYVRYRLVAEQIHYYGEMTLSNFKGFVNHNTGKIHSTVYATHPLVFKEVISTWKHTKIENEIPIKPLHTFFMGHFFNKKVSPPEAIIITSNQQM